MKVLPCGYAPRTLFYQPTADGGIDTLFVGSKDGSVTILSCDRGTWTPNYLPLKKGDSSRMPIRVLLPWEDRLVIGRDDGAVEILEWRKALEAPHCQPVEVIPPRQGDSVRLATWLNRETGDLLISFRERGTRVLRGFPNHHPIQLDEPDGFESLKGIRLATWIRDSERLVLVDHACSLWHWNWQAQPPVAPEPLSDWPTSKMGTGVSMPPATIEDTTFVGPLNGPQKSALAVLIATDRGLFALDLTEESWQAEILPSPIPVLILGLPTFCMAVTFAATSAGARLWVASRSGETLLFENEEAFPAGPKLEEWIRGFRHTQTLKLEAQVLIALSWSLGEESLLALACRDDRVRIVPYSVGPKEKRPVDLLQKAWPLSATSGLALAEEIKKGRGDIGDWPAFAAFARLLEDFAEKDPAGFSDYLVEPRAEAPMAILIHEAERWADDPAERTIVLCQAPRHWVFCMTGLIHRLPDRKEEGYLGILRFLKGLEYAVDRYPSQYFFPVKLSEAIQEAINFVRKWGLYGEANETRQDLVLPLMLLGEKPPRNRLYDRLTYSSLLFRRSYSEQARVASIGQLEEHVRDNSWILRSIPLRGASTPTGNDAPLVSRQLIGVSWRYRGIQLYLLDESSGSPSMRAISWAPEVTKPRFAVEGSEQSAYSRDFLILNDPDDSFCFFLLHARRTGPDSWWGDDLECWRLSFEEKSGQLEVEGEPTRISVPERSHGSAYRMLVLDSPNSEKRDWIIAIGLEGQDGEAAVAIVRLTNQGELRLAHEEPKKAIIHLRTSQFERGSGRSSNGADTSSSFRNRIWSLAKAQNGGFVAGTDNGEIWFVSAELAASAGGEAVLVGKIGSAVSALETRTLKVPSSESSEEISGSHGESRILRIFAGSRDGTVIAFQGRLSKENSSALAAETCVTLWATLEETQIVNISRVKYGLSSEFSDLVLVVTQDGAIRAIDDRDPMDSRLPSGGSGEVANDQAQFVIAKRRAPFPGIRLLRASLHRSCNSAAIVPGESKGDKGQWCRILITSEAGEVELISLHYPRYTAIRKEDFSRHFGDLGRILSLEGDEGISSADTPADPAENPLARPEYLRALDGISKPAPLLPLLMVRILLEPNSGDEFFAAVRPKEYSSQVAGIRDLDRYWLPKPVQPLHGMAACWDKALVKNRVARRRNLDKVCSGLRTALSLAVQHEDVNLYQEICIVVLKRANFLLNSDIFVDSPGVVWELYKRVFDVIERSLQSWNGAPGHAERRVRIVVAKNLVDGLTAHRVFELLDAAYRKDPKSSRFKAINNVLNKRIEGVRQLVWKGDPIVSLESLRAANHSMLRIAYRLSAARAGQEDFTAVRWVFFERYFRRLIFGAAQALGSSLRANDALSHEYARTFALCLCISPEGVVEMTAQLSELGLFVDPHREEDLSARIAAQCRLLHDTFGLLFHPYAMDLFPQVLLKPTGKLEIPPVKNDVPWAKEAAVKIQKDLGQVREIYEFIRKLRQVEACLIEGKGNRFLEPLKLAAEIALKQEPNEGLFRHSWRFWKRAFGKVSNPAEAAINHGLFPIDLPGARDLPSRVRPRAVLFSLELARWAGRQRQELEKLCRQSRIFHPEYKLFDETLEGLQRAAGDFPASAGVQRNLVVSLLGHHLLEDLDLHVLELREIARNLEPDLRVRSDAGSPFPGQSVNLETELGLESRFAKRLEERAAKALGLPKTLRTLSKVLDPGAVHEGENGRSEPGEPDSQLDTMPAMRLDEFVESMHKDWNIKKPIDSAYPISARDRELLGLIFDELLQNQKNHTGSGESSCDVSISEGSAVINLEFPIDCSDEKGKYSKKKVARWEEFCALVEKDQAGQQLVSPNPLPNVSSSGAGLYLCGLAAAMIHWQMNLFTTDEPQRRLRVELKPERAEMDLLKRGRNRIEPGSKPEVLSEGDVIVIDDKPEVALYVWREIGKVPGFSRATADFPAVRSVPTPDGKFRVWWIPADVDWENQLKVCVSSLKGREATRVFLVDVRGPVSGEDPSGAYSCTKVRKYLEESFPLDPPRIIPISAYVQGDHRPDAGEPLKIYSKTPETFAGIVGLVPPLVPGQKTAASLPLGDSSVVHVLVTGAGFEFQPEQPIGETLGVPPTGKLLEGWVNEIFQSSQLVQKAGFPVALAMADNRKFEKWIFDWLATEIPSKSPIRRSRRYKPTTRGSSSELITTDWDLDDYWNQVIAAIWSADLRKYVKDETTVKGWLEHKFRDGFRKAFLGHDWGYLPQACVAAELPWTAWLSTNYTRFANRAIEKRRPSDWRTIEISDEAANFSRQMLFGLPSAKLRYLFKLHGDIGHVLTMAISGKDKTIASGLTSFSPLYLAAQRYLELRVSSEEREVSKIVWHIVGHGLRDDLLVQVVKQVCLSRRSDIEVEFVVVAPGANDHPVNRLYKSLKDIHGEKEHYLGLRVTGSYYLSRLQALGLDHYKDIAKGGQDLVEPAGLRKISRTLGKPGLRKLVRKTPPTGLGQP